MENNIKLTDPTYKQWLTELKGKIRSSQVKAAIAVNSTLIQFYWELGKMITEKQTAYGTGFIPQLSKDLQEEFSEMKGLSARNLAFCRQFYQFYSSAFLQQPLANLKPTDIESVQNTNNEELTILQQPVAKLQDRSRVGNQMNQQPSLQNQNDNHLNIISQQPVDQLPWGHNILIFTKSKDKAEAHFYIRQTIANNWSRDTLGLQIKTDFVQQERKGCIKFQKHFARATV